MAALVALLEKRRKAARTRLAAALAERSTGDFLIDLLAFTEARGWLSTDDIGQSVGLAAPVTPFAERLIARLRRKVEKLGRDPEALSPEERHDLRKRFKRLRYAYDFFEPLMPKSARRKLLPRVKAAQDVLGVLNDIHMAHVMLDDVHAVGPKAGAVERAIGLLPRLAQCARQGHLGTALGRSVAGLSLPVAEIGGLHIRKNTWTCRCGRGGVFLLGSIDMSERTVITPGHDPSL